MSHLLLGKGRGIEQGDSAMGTLSFYNTWSPFKRGKVTHFISCVLDNSGYIHYNFSHLGGT